MLSRRSIRNFMGLSGLEIYKSEEVSKKENEDESRGFYFLIWVYVMNKKKFGLAGKRYH